jgi:hypothetical protein
MNNNNFFTKLENTKPFLKMALEGFAGSGKTFTAAQIAIGLHKYINSTLPIVWYDTERALKALKPYFDKVSIEILTRESRSLADLNRTIDLCCQGASQILVIDSITHVWEAFIEAYKAEKRRSFIQFQDWGVIKPKWKKEFSDRIVMSNLHIIFTGRAGYEYENEINETTGKMELIKSGIKMKVENETEYEPDIVVLLTKSKELKGNKLQIFRTAEILKDRTNTIDSKTFPNPKFNDFFPAIEILLNGCARESIIEENKDEFATFEENHHKSKQQREILLEEIKGIFNELFPGKSSNFVSIKTEVSYEIFRTRSWTAIENMSLNELEMGFSRLSLSKPLIEKYMQSCASEELEFDNSKIINILKESVTKIN